MSARCCVCAKDHAGYQHACTRCTDKLRRQLRELETYAAVLHVFVQPGASGMATRGAPGFGSRSPARDDVIAALDVRSTAELLGEDDLAWYPVISIPGGVHYIANGVRHELASHLPVPPQWTVTSEVAYLLGQLANVVMHTWVAEFARLLGILHKQARALAHDQPPRPLGACLGVQCGGAVYPTWRGGEDGARCSRCLRIYTGLDLVRLSVAQEVQ